MNDSTDEVPDAPKVEKPEEEVLLSEPEPDSGSGSEPGDDALALDLSDDTAAGAESTPAPRPPKPEMSTAAVEQIQARTGTEPDSSQAGQVQAPPTREELEKQLIVAQGLIDAQRNRLTDYEEKEEEFYARPSTPPKFWLSGGTLKLLAAAAIVLIACTTVAYQFLPQDDVAGKVSGSTTNETSSDAIDISGELVELPPSPDFTGDAQTGAVKTEVRTNEE